MRKYILLILLLLLPLSYMVITRQNNLSPAEYVTKETIIVNLYPPSTGSALQFMIDYPENMAITDSPDFIHIINNQTGEKFYASQPYSYAQKHYFDFYNIDKTEMADLELVLSKVIVNTREYGDFTLSIPSIGNTISVDTLFSFKHGAFHAIVIESYTSDTGYLTVTIRGDFISKNNDVSIDSIIGKDNVIMVDADQGNIHLLLDPDAAGTGKTIHYSRVLYRVDTDFHYTVKR